MQRFISLLLSSLLLINTCLAGVACAQDEVVFYHTDNFGTPVAMTDMSGKVVWRADELPFGEQYKTEEISTKNNHRYLGRELDRETGLIYMGARYLDPATGRFNRPDPVGLVDPATGKINQEMLLNPQRQNRYAYALNNPYKYADADGRSPDILASSDAAAYYTMRADEIGADINTMKGTNRTAQHVQKEAFSQLGAMVSMYGGGAISSTRVPINHKIYGFLEKLTAPKSLKIYTLIVK